MVVAEASVDCKEYLHVLRVELHSLHLPHSLQLKVKVYINPFALVHFPVFHPGQRSPTAISCLKFIGDGEHN